MKRIIPQVVLLIGKNGQVGWELRRTLAPLGRLVCVDYPEIDLSNPDSLRKWMRDISPDVVINAGAYTAVDKAEEEGDLVMRINGVAPGVLAEETRRRGALLIHYSTDYVFDGAKGEPYTEEDMPNPLGVYGRSKLAGDKAVEGVGGDYLIFRLCWVYGMRGRNFLLTMMRLARERDMLRVVSDQIGCPTWSRMIAEATALAIARVGSISTLDSVGGLFNLSAVGSTSWHGFASAIVDQMPLDIRKCREVKAISTSEYPTPARRPAYSALSSEKLRRVFGLQLPHWSESLCAALGDER